MPPEFDDDEEIKDGLGRPRRDGVPEMARPDPAAREMRASVEGSQQKRWPDLEKTADTPAPKPEVPAPAPKAGPISDKTERLDDVIAKLREHGAMTVAAAPPPPAPPRPEASPPPVREKVAAPVAQPAAAGRKLVAYGESPPPPVRRPPRPVAPAAAPVASATPASPAPGPAGLRTRWIGIGLVVAAIVALFTLTLWVLISLVR